MRNTFPYAGLPAEQVWKHAVSSVPAGAVDPAGTARFSIAPDARIASAGSCFAARIASGLQGSAWNYFVTEPGPHDAAPDWLRAHHYGTYSARYGEIYTTLQLAQLAQRCIGEFTPHESPWVRNDRLHDPFRPRISPDGFASLTLLEADRALHLDAIRRLLTECDVFVFTMGLTEVWCARSDGSAFPLCPGAGIGRFDSTRYVFRNLTVDENVRYFEAFLRIATALNPHIRIVLTVSPVPLVATIEPHHVLQSTVYSKSVLRVAAEMLRNAHPNVEYFPAYEMVATGFDGVDHFTADRRDVREDVVERVIASFRRAFTPPGDVPEVQETPQVHITIGAEDIARNTVPLAGYDPCDDAFAADFITVRDRPE